MFRTDLPVTANAFADRSAELSRLETLVRGLARGEPSWLAILGPRKIGKTSLLLELARRNTDPGVAFVVLDTFEESPPSLRIFPRYALRLLDAVFSREIGKSLEALSRQPSEFRLALQASARFLSLTPASRGDILELPDRKPDQRLAEDALRLPEEIAEELGLRVLVAWDEFQELGSLVSGSAGFDPFPLMRSIWQRHRRTAYVVSGSQRTTLSRLLTAERSPFFQHFSLLELGPFLREEAIKLLVTSAPDDRPIPEALAALAVDALGGHPFYLQMLGEALTAQLPPYDEGSLREALQELLFSRTGRLALYFENSYQGLVGRSTYLAGTLQALAHGSRRLTEVSEAIGAPSGSTVKYLERVGDAVKRTEDGRYALADPTLGLWLRWREPGGTVVPMATLGDEAEQRIAAELASMGFDLVYQSRASRGAFDLLATRGGVQLGVQVKRSRPPLRFTVAAWNRMEAEARRFGWRWVVAAVEPPPGEGVLVLDPGKARIGREVRVGTDAAIPNLLAWADTAPGGGEAVD